MEKQNLLVCAGGSLDETSWFVGGSWEPGASYSHAPQGNMQGHIN